jgi:hypothetical protein
MLFSHLSINKSKVYPVILYGDNLDLESYAIDEAS